MGRDDSGWTGEKDVTEHPQVENEHVDRLLDDNLGNLENVDDLINPEVLDESVPEEEVEGDDERDDNSSDNYGENENNDNDDNSENDENYDENNTTTERNRKSKRRLVHSLDSCLDPANYDPYTFPLQRKEGYKEQTGEKNYVAEFQESRTRSSCCCCCC